LKYAEQARLTLPLKHNPLDPLRLKATWVEAFVNRMRWRDVNRR
jgi:hypothetical protein